MKTYCVVGQWCNETQRYPKVEKNPWMTLPGDYQVVLNVCSSRRSQIFSSITAPKLQREVKSVSRPMGNIFHFGRCDLDYGQVFLPETMDLECEGVTQLSQTFRSEPAKVGVESDAIPHLNRGYLAF